ncbi:MAG TPA: hypothetical protein VH436_05465 [Vicinamibacterales bacterium]
MNSTRRMIVSTALAAAGIGIAVPAAAQAPANDPNPGNLTLTGSFDVVSTYMFRGIRQHSTGVALWPAADLGIAVYSSDKGGLRSAGVNTGTWNSLHTGDTGSDGPSGKLWYESDFYAALGLGFDKGVSFTTTYTAYTSPNNSYSTVKEIMFKLALDDSGYLHKAAVKPYVIVAREFNAEADGLTNGQADAGQNAGTYLEVGGAPGYSGSKASVAFPIKAGFSLSNYYELNVGTSAVPAYVDNKFGFFSIAGIATVPLGGTTGFGAWNVHGGVEYQALGETTKAFNGGDSSRVIGSVGIGFTY